MRKEYIENAKKHTTTITVNLQKVLDALTENITLISGLKCEYDILYDGCTVIIWDDEKTTCNNPTDAIKALAKISKELFE